MKITAEQYALLKTMAEDVVASNSYHPSYRQFIKGDPKDKGVFSVKGTVAAVLIGMARAVEKGNDPACDILFAPLYGVEDKPNKKPEEPDVFTAEALAKIPAGKPDPSTLARPKKDSILKDSVIHAEGESWVDENGRHWKLVNGKMVQQKRPKAIQH